MTNKDFLLKRLSVVEYRVGLYVNAKKEPLILNRIKKLLRHPLRVLRVTLYKLGIIKKADVKVVMFWKKKFILPMWDENVLIAYYSNSFGLNEFFLVRYLINNLKQNDVFYDIGSSFGLYTFLAEELTSNIYTFEPNPHTVKYISMNVKPETKVEEVAVSDATGEVSFYDTFDSNKSGMSSMFPDIASGTSAGTYKSITVPAITLDNYIISHKIPTIIKMDVMNADYMVLKGGEKLFKEYSPVIALRMYNTPLAIERTRLSLDLLKKYGYSSYSLKEDGSLEHFNIEPNKLKFASTFIFKK